MKSIIEVFISTDTPVFIWGPPGVGKSDIVRQIATEHKLPLIDIRAVLLDPVDLRGLPTVVNGKALWAQPDFLPNAARDGATGILFLDELNAAPQSVQAACFQLILDRKVGEYVLPPGWRIVAAGNRQGDRAAAQRMPTALANRFAHVDFEPDYNTWKTWAVKNNMSPMLIAFLGYRPELLHKMGDTDVRAFPTPRSWAQVSKVSAYVQHGSRLTANVALVGEGAAMEFEGFMDTWRDLPSIDDVLRTPIKTRVPSTPSGLYAISTALANFANKSNFAAVLTYVQRLGTEFEVLTVVDSIKRDSSLTETTAFIKWAARNQDVTL